MATKKQKAAARRNIKRAQAARWQLKPHTAKKAKRSRVMLDNVKTLI